VVAVRVELFASQAYDGGQLAKTAEITVAEVAKKAKKVA